MTAPDTGPAGYAAEVAALLDAAGCLGAWLAAWEGRDEDGPDAQARRSANHAMDAIDGALAGLHRVRARLVGEIRQSDDATAARVDALLAETEARRGRR